MTNLCWKGQCTFQDPSHTVCTTTLKSDLQTQSIYIYVYIYKFLAITHTHTSIHTHTHTRTHTHTHTHTHPPPPKRQSLWHCPCVQQQYIKLGDAGIEILPSRPTFQHQGQMVWSTTIPSNFSTPGSDGVVYYHPIQLFKTRVWYGLQPSHPTFQHQGQMVWSTTIPSKLFNTRVRWCGLLPSHPTFQHQGQMVWSTTIPSNFSTPGSDGVVYYHPIQLFKTRGLVWSTTIPSNFSTPGSGMVYYHSIQLFNTRVSWYGLLPSHPTFQHQGLVWSTTIPFNFSTPGSTDEISGN